MLVFDDARDDPVGPALRHRPGLRRQGGRDPLRGVRRPPHRPQLRLPGPQGDPQGRRRGAARGSAGCSAEILESAVAAATPYAVPVTMKTRKGLDDDHLTYLDAGRIAEDSGCAAIALHGRTVAAGLLRARPTGRRSPGWSSTSTSRSSATATSGRPPTRSGWSSETGAAGVVVGRGCLGRPWLFRDLAAAFSARRRPSHHPADPRRGARR